jgi:hypothetical protein
MIARRDLYLSAPMAGDRPLKGLSRLSLICARDMAAIQHADARRSGDDAQRVDALLIMMRVRAEIAHRAKEHARQVRAA